MKSSVINVIVLCLLIQLVTVCVLPCSAGNETRTVYTFKEVESVLAKACNVTKASVLMFDTIYEEYPLSRALSKAASTNHLYKDNMYDCDDIAFSVKAIVTRHISELRKSGGAIMLGIAFATKKDDDGHVVNVCIVNEEVYIYDQQHNYGSNIVTISDFLKEGYKIIMIII